MVFLKPLLRYADFKGRASRAEYWGFFLFQSVLGGLFGAVMVLSLTQGENGAAGFLISAALMAVTALAFVVPYWAVSVRRLHDTDRSAWWLLLQTPSVLAPLSFVGAILGAVSGGGEPSQAAAGAVLAMAGGGILMMVLGGIGSGILMLLMWLPGTEGENRFGSDPRSPQAGFHLGSGPSEGLDNDRLDALFAEARREREQTAQAEPSWDPVMPTQGFGRRGLSG